MSITPLRRRMKSEESRTGALEAARALLIEAGPQAVTLKAVSARIGRTHANLLHHFGSAAGLQKALTAYLAESICAGIEAAVEEARIAATGDPAASPLRTIVDLTFDAYDKEGAGALATWMLLTGNEDALDPVVETIHALVHRLAEGMPGAPWAEPAVLHDHTLALVLMAMGDALMGGPLTASLGVARGRSRDLAVQMLESVLAAPSSS